MKPKQSINNNDELGDERGDVPGWVLITLMTAAMVVLLWSLAAPALTTVFNQAMSKVVAF